MLVAFFMAEEKQSRGNVTLRLYTCHPTRPAVPPWAHAGLLWMWYRQRSRLLATGACWWPLPSTLIFLAGQLRQSWERTNSSAINTNAFSQMTSRSTRKQYYKHQLHFRLASAVVWTGKNTHSESLQANRSWSKSLRYWKAVFVICLFIFSSI